MRKAKLTKIFHPKNDLHLVEALKSMRGQALITLLFFMAVAITITSAATIVIVVNSLSVTKFEQSMSAYYVAESGAENAMLRLLRNPIYTGETLPVGLGSAFIQVTGSDPKTITSEGTVGNFKRKIQVVAGYASGILTATSWKEVF